MAIDVHSISCESNYHEMATATRPYRMQARAAAAEEATERILDAAEQLYWANPARPVTLAAVAGEAGVSVHSIIRRFGGQEGLFDAAVGRSITRVTAQRNEADPSDLPDVVRTLVEHYEQMGDRSLRLIEAGQTVPSVKELADRGRELHVEWCERMFAEPLARRRGAARKRLVAQLVALCDVYTWLLLRRQRGLSRRETERAILEMLTPLVDGRTPS
jgi:AcrR family transcriptional regulator